MGRCDERDAIVRPLCREALADEPCEVRFSVGNGLGQRMRRDAHKVGGRTMSLPGRKHHVADRAQ